MSAESWQNTCPRCGWANSGAERRCMKCGQPLRTSPGLLVAGESASSAIAPTSQPKTRRVVQPGGFFPRLIAIIIDTLILAVVTVPIAYLVLAQRVTPTGQSNAFLDQLKGLSGSNSTPEQLTQLAQLSAGIAILLLFYYVGTWSILGGSPGQLVMSLRMVDRSAKTVGFGRALLRYIMKGFFGFLWPVSALMVAFGKDKRAIHDFLAGTYVIQFLDPKLEDFDAVLPPPVTSPVPQETYVGAAPAAAAVSGPAPAAPEPAAPEPGAPEPAAPEPAAPEPAAAPAGPPPPAAPSTPGGGAPVPAAAPMAPVPAPPMVPAAPDQSAFHRYPSPGEPPPKPTPAAAPDLPLFPTSDPGGYQPMAPAPPAPAPPSAPADPGSGAPAYRPPTQPYALPFAPKAPLQDGSPPDAAPPADPPTP
jgi:uncharacterized RDD family membrane protein YckC